MTDQAYVARALGISLTLVGALATGCAETDVIASRIDASEDASTELDAESLDAGEIVPITLPAVTFATSTGAYIGAENNGGGAVLATAPTAQAWETLTLVDVNGGSLESGDLVYVRAGNGQYFQAIDGGGTTLNVSADVPGPWETFRIVRLAGAGLVATGNQVGLQTSGGQWVSATNGGGSTVTAMGQALEGWETLVIGLGTANAPRSMARGK